MADVSVSPQLFALFAALVEETCGLHYGPRDHDILAAKLTAHVADQGEDSLLDYYYRLRYDDPDGVERTRLLDALLVHETYFFRELPPLQQLVDGYLAERVRAGGRPRVWSAACATGEEPLTLAMLLDQRGMLDAVDLLATDVSANAIARARSGKHGRRSLRDGHPAELAGRYLDATAREITVTPRIQAAVRFGTANLVDDAAVTALGRFDVIVCRNVLIYFRDELVARVVERLARSLEADGVLVVGVSESLLRYSTTLACEERGHSFFYRRRAA
ncbi:MAG TPA: CheR family methyltransferase [Kofleriaceae bacterium]|nr:CheR family methyltransferase [Kofleriaceae bacterium]